MNRDKNFWSWIFLSAALACAAPRARAAETAVQTVSPAVLNLQDAFAKVSETAKPVVVNITSIHVENVQEMPFEFFFWGPEDPFERFFNPDPRHPQAPRSQQRKVPATGSGVLIDADGTILTNEHVVRQADEIKVTLADDPEKKWDGRVIGRDQRTDLAVIKIKTNRKLPFAKLGDSDKIRVGDWAIAIGSPFGLEQTVTAGIISATRQNLPIEGANFKNIIQTDAAINPGNSGGPLLNIFGEVIGINTAIFTPSGGFAGVGFAIPINQAKEILPQLKNKGKVTRSWIGISLEAKLNEATVKALGLPDKEGALVTSVVINQPAAKAGIKRGDILREFDGHKIHDTFDLQTVVAATPPGKKVAVKVFRRRKELTFELTTAEAPSSIEALRDRTQGETEPGDETASTSTFRWNGLTVQELSPAKRDYFAVPAAENGVVVTEIKAGSKAEKIGFAPGDLIRAVNQEPVPDVAALEGLLKDVTLKQGIVFDIIRQGQSLYLSYSEPEK